MKHSKIQLPSLKSRDPIHGAIASFSLKWTVFVFGSFLAFILSGCGSHPLKKPETSIGHEELAGNRPLRIRDYRHANSTLREVYRQLPEPTLYCGCKFDPNRKYASAAGDCSFSPADPGKRTDEYKVHWEHVVPAARLGSSRACWQSNYCQRENGKPYGGRSCCRKTDRLFRAMEADLHNLRPAIGEINRHRQDYNFGEIEGGERKYGTCDMEISSANDVAEPPDSAKGVIARSYLYMDAAYGIELTPEESAQYWQWNRAFPPKGPEIARNEMIRKIQGNPNPFIQNYSSMTGKEKEMEKGPTSNAFPERGSRKGPDAKINPGSCLLL